MRGIVIATILIASAFVFSDSRAQNWTQLSKGNFPARVQSLDWQNGSSIRAGQALTFGRWSVSFGQNVGAFYTDSTDDIGPAADSAIFIKGLVCSNSAVGSVGCILRLVRGGRSVSCSLEAADPSANTRDSLNLNTVITCPSQLRLQ
jgi:hypothetical protein